MPTHWTYDDLNTEVDLAQGDLIEPTDELRRVLEGVHRHFLDPKYISFIVLSQSCDLVRRSNSKGLPITLGVVRELSAVMPDLLERICGSDLPHVYHNNSKVDARRFIERVINQNEQSVGLFYLHPDGDAGIATPSVAMLRVSIALRTEHYEKIRMARRGRLKPEFQAKLGWLVGNLFSRVGTGDWSEPEPRKKEQKKIIDDVLEGLGEVIWAADEVISAAKQGGVSLQSITKAERAKVLKTFEPRPAREILLEVLSRMMEAPDLAIPEEKRQMLVKRLPNNSEFAAVLKRLR